LFKVASRLALSTVLLGAGAGAAVSMLVIHMPGLFLSVTSAMDPHCTAPLAV
jgi:hypothetical protein